MEQEIHFIELPKFLKTKVDTTRKLDQWLLFIDYSRKELIKMAEEKNNQIREAEAQYEYLTGDDNVRRLAFLRRKFELDYNSGLACAEERGEARGKAEGKGDGIKWVAKKMKKARMDIEEIVKITGLSKEEIEQL